MSVKYEMDLQPVQRVPLPGDYCILVLNTCLIGNVWITQQQKQLQRLTIPISV